MKTQNEFDKIQAFLRNEMTEQEAKAFEQRIQSEASLAKEVAWHRMIQEGLLLVNEAKKEKIVPLQRRPQNWSLMIAAAAILLLFATSPWWFSLLNSDSKGGISSYQHDNPSLTYTGANEKGDSLMQLYLSPVSLQKDAQLELNTIVFDEIGFSQAEEIVKNMDEDAPVRINSALQIKKWLNQFPKSKQDSLSVFAALVQLNANKFFEASQYLERSKTNGPSNARKSWYQMLIHFKAEEWDEAEPLLQQILQDSSHIKYPMAKKLAPKIPDRQ